VRGRLVGVTLTIVILTACGADESAAPPGSPSAPASPAQAVPTIPRGALDGYVVRSRALDATALAEASTDPAAMTTLLADAGFETGSERRFTARWKPLTEVTTQVLRFDEAGGADAYLAWLRSHGDDLLGSGAGSSTPPDLPGAVAFVHVPCSGCTKDPLQYLTVWTRGRYALILLLGGAHAGRAAATPLARDLDTRVRMEG